MWVHVLNTKNAGRDASEITSGSSDVNATFYYPDDSNILNSANSRPTFCFAVARNGRLTDIFFRHPRLLMLVTRYREMLQVVPIVALLLPPVTPSNKGVITCQQQFIAPVLEQ
jgi:hypothetical protein